MVTTPEAINALFPSAVSFKDYRVMDAAIIYWNPALGSQPTQAQLDAVTQAQVDAAKDTKEAIDKPEQNELRKSIVDDIAKCDEIIALSAVNLTQALNRLQQLARINKRILRYLKKTIE